MDGRNREVPEIPGEYEEAHVSAKEFTYIEEKWNDYSNKPLLFK